MKMDPGAVLKNIEHHDFDIFGKYNMTEEEAAAIVPVLRSLGSKWVCLKCGSVNENARRFCSWCDSDRNEAEQKLPKDIFYGRWISEDNEMGNKICRCNKCHYLSESQTNYCPKCGAKMEGENDSLLQRGAL